MKDRRRDTTEIRAENGSLEDWQRAMVGHWAKYSMRDKVRDTGEIGTGDEGGEKRHVGNTDIGRLTGIWQRVWGRGQRMREERRDTWEIGTEDGSLGYGREYGAED